MAERELLFDEIVIGQEFPPSTFEITEEAVMKYAEAIGDPEPRYANTTSSDGSIVRKVVAHPTIAGFFTRPGRLLPSYLKMPPGSVQVEQRYTFSNPILPGDTMVTATRVGDKYIKKERKYVVLEISTLNQRGETVLQGSLVGMWSK